MSTQQFSLIPHFDGATYDPSKDQVRLSEQLKEVRYFLLLGGWHTLAEIRQHVEKQLGRTISEAGVSARCRDLRKARFGGYVVERRRKDDGSVWEYRIKE